jgi:hypothetical protein
VKSEDRLVPDDLNARSGPRVFAGLLLSGQRVDWRYSLVVILVITGLFSTPLALGSIRNRAYVAVREQIEKENNVREISLWQAKDDAPPLNAERRAEIADGLPGARVVGNYKVVVSVEGPEGADLPTLQTLEPEDPRAAPLGIVPGVPAKFGLTDLVISDALGQLLYVKGEDDKEQREKKWQALWTADGRFRGGPLRLSVNDQPLAPAFRVVARRTLPGRGLYGSQALGEALRRYSRGFGAPGIGLPIDEGLTQAALPKLAAPRCVLLLDRDDPTCDRTGQDRLLARLRLLHHAVGGEVRPPLGDLATHRAVAVALREVVHEGKAVRIEEMRGDCGEVLAPQLVESCTGSLVVPDLHRAVRLEVPGRPAAALPVQVVAGGAEVRALLPGAAQLASRHGRAPAASDGAFDLAVPAHFGLEVGVAVTLRVGEIAVPAQVQSFYRCGQTIDPCPVLADPEAVLRLANLAEGTVELRSVEPVVFVPAATGEEYDEILVYPATVEAVEPTSAALKKLLPGYAVQYNAAALDKLRRQDDRLEALFNLTIALSALFLVLALGALARINIERRSRQMAQMLILGFARGFVRRLVVAEYLLLTLFAALAAAGLTHLLCLVARVLLAKTTTESAGQDFGVIVQSMAVDPKAFLVVFAVVAVCTWLIAIVSAWRAAQADPLDLLD